MKDNIITIKKSHAKVMRCPVCSNQKHTQDKIHGRGKRVFNLRENDNKSGWRCSVCGKEI